MAMVARLATGRPPARGTADRAARELVGPANPALDRPPARERRLERALAIAARFVDRRERTVAEVRGRLARDDVDADTIDAVIDELGACGQLDDAAFARRYVQDRRALEQWGSRRIERGLLGRGVASELVDAALRGDPAHAEREAAAALLLRRFPQPPCDPRDRQRALGVLVRKGYDVELASELIRAHAHGDLT